MMESELLIGGILFFTGALAGFIDSIVGGGGLISLPAIMLTNLPIATCLGTNKLSSVFGSGTAMINFAKNGLVNWSYEKRLGCYLPSRTYAWLEVISIHGGGHYHWSL